MTILGYLRDYFREFPGLAGERLDIDCLAEKPDSYSIDAVPCEPVVKTYLDGSAVRRYLFTISSRSYFGTDLAQQEKNLAFFENLGIWLEKRQEVRRFPRLGAGRKVRRLSVVSSAYPYIISEAGVARYQIQLQLEYLQEVNYEA